MLQSLDTLIAFVVIMTIASLFVTIIVQMFSAALSLRGKSLANALALTFQTVDPSLADRAHQLAARILCDPLLSDSTRTEKNRRSLSAASDRTKPWHFANLSGAMLLATAIRPEEVYAAIRRLASPVIVPTAKETSAISVEPGESEVGAMASQIDPLSEAAKSVIRALGTMPDEAQELKSQTEALVKIDQIGLRDALKDKLVAAVLETSARARLESCFKTAQDRSQQWFQLHTRGLTIGASVMVALVLQLDAVEVFHYVSTNAAGRAALVANAEKIIKEGDGVLDEKGGLVKRVADAWNANTNHGALKIENAAGLVHTGQLENAVLKLYAETGNPSFKSREELEKAYQKLVAAVTEAYYKDQGQKISDLTKEVSATGFDLVPKRFWRWPASSDTDDIQSLLNIGPHVFGILLFAGLLTLGAPYWYNMLKNLSSLRPALAQRVGKGEKSPDEKTK